MKIRFINFRGSIPVTFGQEPHTSQHQWTRILGIEIGGWFIGLIY